MKRSCILFDKANEAEEDVARHDGRSNEKSRGSTAVIETWSLFRVPVPYGTRLALKNISHP